MKGYLFIANGRYVSREQEDSLEPVRTSSFAEASLYAADHLGYRLYMGINRTYTDKLKNEKYDIVYYNQHIYRRVFDIKNNWIAYRNLCYFLESHPEIEVIHCNTPIGGVLGRICGKKYGKKVIYTAHGFHFYKGAPFINRTLFKIIERFLARKTDCLITINQEDYEAAKKFRLSRGGQVFKVNGVGVDLTSFDKVKIDRIEKRNSLGIAENAIVGIVVGDLNENKNVETLIRALPYSDNRIHLLICGFGPLERKLKHIASEEGVKERCHFLGFRTDVKELYMASDMFVFASQREGLPRSTMEAMMAGLPCVVSKIRGNVDLIDENQGGLLVHAKDIDSFAKAMTIMAQSPSMREQFGAYNKEHIKLYDMNVVKKQMLDIFKAL